MEKQELVDWLDYCHEELSGFAGVKVSEESKEHFREAYLIIKHIIQNGRKMIERNAILLADEFPELVSELLRESATGAMETIRWFIKTIYAKGYTITYSPTWNSKVLKKSGK